MTASERLRELSAAARPERGGDIHQESADIAIDALPLIADVVEAAEKWGLHHDYWESVNDCSVCSALAALRDALEESGAPRRTSST